MELIVRQMQRLCASPRLSSLAQNAGVLACNVHTSATLRMPYEKPTGPIKWPKYNEKIYPPQQPGEERRPAYVCHMRTNIKYSPWKMWYVAEMIRGMSIEEALKQLSFINQQGAVRVKEILLEAQKLAVEKHNVEYKSNLWVAESFVGKGITVKGMRRHARGRFGSVAYHHCHYFVRLEEGSPPEHILPWKEPQTGPKMLAEWLEGIRQRRITGSL